MEDIKTRCAAGHLEKRMLRVNDISDTDHLMSLFEIHVVSHYPGHVYKPCA